MRAGICWLGLVAAAVTAAGADFEADLRAAAELCQEKQHEQAIQAYLQLAAGRSELDERYEAIREAAVCARLHLGNESRALDICQRLDAGPYRMACRAVVYQWATSPAKVLAELRDEDIAAWPESLAAIGFAVRGSAFFNAKQGPQAARDFVRAFQFGKTFAKWSALGRLGDTYWKLLDDELLAEACYRKCMADFGGGWPGLQARLNLADLLRSQQRYEAALQCLNGAPPVGGVWKASLRISAAKVHLAAGQKPQAAACLDEALATVGVMAHQKKECEALRAELK